MNRDYTKKANERGARIRESYRIADTGRAENQPGAGGIAHLHQWAADRQKHYDDLERITATAASASAEIERLRARVEELEAGQKQVKVCIATISMAVTIRPELAPAFSTVLKMLLPAVGWEDCLATEGDDKPVDSARPAPIAPTGDTQGVGVHPAPNVTLAGGK